MAPCLTTRSGHGGPDPSAARWASILDRVASLNHVSSASSAAGVLHALLQLMHLDSAAFLCVIRADKIRTTHRSVLACDPRWCVEFAQHGWYEDNPWLRHAMAGGDLIYGADLPVRTQDTDFMRLSLRLGFRSSLVAPAPRTAELPRAMVLILGSTHPHAFSGESAARLRMVARCLTTELQQCMLRLLREELIRQSALTPAEIELLRRQTQGQASKTIAAALNIRSVTVDSRFQQIIAKLQTTNRASASRIARLYGVL